MLVCLKKLSNVCFLVSVALSSGDEAPVPLPPRKKAVKKAAKELPALGNYFHNFMLYIIYCVQ